MKSLIAILVFSIGATASADVCNKLNTGEMMDLAEAALQKENLSCLDVDGATKCFVQITGGVSEYRDGLLAIPYISMTNNGLRAKFGNVLINENCEVQYVQKSSDYREPIRTIKVKK